MGDYRLPPDLARLFADMTNRLGALERTRVLPSGSGAPTGTPANGAVYVDVVGSRLYVGVGGAWKSTALT